jgi:hypothetical protein
VPSASTLLGPRSAEILLLNDQMVCDLCREGGRFSWHWYVRTAEGECVLTGSQFNQRPVPIRHELTLCGLGEIRKENVARDRRESRLRLDPQFVEITNRLAVNYKLPQAIATGAQLRVSRKKTRQSG